MSHSDDRYTTNLLLAALPHVDLAMLEPFFTREKLEQEKVLVYPNQPIEYVWFPEAGVASVVAHRIDSGSTEVGISVGTVSPAHLSFLGQTPRRTRSSCRSKVAPAYASRQLIS